MTQTNTTVLFLDVDGTLSPLGEHLTNPWGDQVEVPSPSFGNVITSPTLLARIGQMPVQLVWATDWESPSTTFTPALMGLDAPADQLARTGAGTSPWWKADAALAWLDTHPHVRRVIWCDDHLNRKDTRTGTRRTVLGRELDARAIAHQFIVPVKNVGLTPAHLASINTNLKGPTS